MAAVLVCQGLRVAGKYVLLSWCGASERWLVQDTGASAKPLGTVVVAGAYGATTTELHAAATAMLRPLTPPTPAPKLTAAAVPQPPSPVPGTGLSLEALGRRVPRRLEHPSFVVLAAPLLEPNEHDLKYTEAEVEVIRKQAQRTIDAFMIEHEAKLQVGWRLERVFLSARAPCVDGVPSRVCLVPPQSQLEEEKIHLAAMWRSDLEVRFLWVWPR